MKKMSHRGRELKVQNVKCKVVESLGDGILSLATNPLDKLRTGSHEYLLSRAQVNTNWHESIGPRKGTKVTKKN